MSKDVVGSRSGFLCQYMSNHPDTLVAYVKYFGKVDEEVTSARMTAIDSKSMTLDYVVGGKTKTSRIDIDPPIETYDEVKPRLIAMREDALEGVGMISRPVVSSYRVPKLAATTAVLLGSLIYTTVADTPSIGSQIRTAVGGTRILKRIWAFVVAVHAGEAVYMAGLCKQHKTGLGLGSLWVFSIALLGFPFFVEFRRIVQQERIASIRKTS
ncbi:hypothetical protein BDV93DRAFT_493615 [Ceratobasidium sp. AG-I]|nr:hypothetical protein BDV93DRAFT_493615 [Ceratobasidium sp. AG-I]